MIEGGSNVKLVGRADRVEDDVVMIFRRISELPEIPYSRAFHTVEFVFAYFQ